MQLPKQVDVPVEVGALESGLTGLVQAVAISAASQGAKPDVDEWLVASSAAFSTYVYDPALNMYAEGAEFSRDGDFFSNYGALEALGYFSGWYGKDVNGATDEDFWKLIRFELASGRPLVSVGFGTDDVVVLTGYREGKGARVVTVSNGRSSHEFDLMSGRPQGESENFVNYVVAVRPGDRGLLALERQAAGVLQWAVRHAFAGKEFLHETRENYAPGLLGGVRVAGLNLEEAAVALWFEKHAEARKISRGAAAQVLGRWETWLELDGLGQVASAFREASESLDGTQAGYAQALAHERRAFEAMRALVEHLPTTFG